MLSFSEPKVRYNISVVHCIYSLTEGALLPLEMNLRPPGGITVGILSFIFRVAKVTFDYL